jgi:hypothetical protein
LNSSRDKDKDKENNGSISSRGQVGITSGNLTKADGGKYWDERFATEEHFEWYSGWPLLGPAMQREFNHCKLQKQQLKVLIVGCGNSPFSQAMFDAGYRNIWNMDISNNVIQYMREKHDAIFYKKFPQTVSPTANVYSTHDRKSRKSSCSSGEGDGIDTDFDMQDASNLYPMRWDAADVTDMKSLYEDEQFDLVIDKGTLDALQCIKGKSEVMVPQMLMEVSRVLKYKTGVFVCIAFSERFKWIRKRSVYNWNTKLVMIQKKSGGGRDVAVHFCYKDAKPIASVAVAASDSASTTSSTSASTTIASSPSPRKPFPPSPRRFL